MLSEFQAKKAQHFFRVFDADKDGFMEQSDLEAVVNKLATVRGWKKGTLGYDNLYDRWMFVWSALEKAADQNRDNIVSPKEWIDLTDKLLASEGGYASVMNAIGNLTFDAVDPDDDGKIDHNDWRAFSAAHGISADNADRAFARLDLNGDGSISREETMAHLRDFFYSNDPNAPGNLFFGPL